MPQHGQDEIDREKDAKWATHKGRWIAHYNSANVSKETAESLNFKQCRV